jgi:cyanuric acid amidohydrolase
MPIARVHRVSARAPDDVSGIEAAIAAGRIDPKGVVAVLAKTEGNGLVNDFSRGFATLRLRQLFERFLPHEEAAKLCLVMSGGTEGGMAPHWIVFERKDGDGGQRPALAIGRTHTPALPFQHLGRLGQVDQVTAGVEAAMRDAGITDPEHVHFVQIKCPLLTAQRVGEALRSGATVATSDTLKSMGLSRAASTLGAAVALGEVERHNLSDADIATRWELWSSRSSSSAGIELLGHEIIVMGMAPGWSGPLAIDHALMADAIDIEPVRAALDRLGCQLPGSYRRNNASGWLQCWPRRRRATTASCAVIAIACWMIPISPRHATRAHSSAARSRVSSAMPRFMFQAAPSTRVLTAAGRSR